MFEVVEEQPTAFKNLLERSAACSDVMNAQCASGEPLSKMTRCQRTNK